MLSSSSYKIWECKRYVLILIKNNHNHSKSVKINSPTHKTIDTSRLDASTMLILTDRKRTML